jgi:cellulose synthase/poly-beta-1,6-N-acetylglucosamine synthase-like glycosyltransferase
MRSNLFINYLFVISVILIWFMLGYQLLLFLLGFYYSRRSAQEKVQLAKTPLSLPRISLIIPARNEALVIKKTLESILASEYPCDRLEVIVVNDGSTDKTEAIVNEHMRVDARVKLINIPLGLGGRGKSAALNIGLRHARHEIVGVYDADNQPEPDALKFLAEQLAQDASLGAVIGKFRALNKSENLLLRCLNIESLSFQWIVQAGRWMLLKVCTLPGTNFLVRKPILEQLRGWDEQALTEDAELTIRICAGGHRIKFVPYAVTWEQEPRTLRAWVRQRTRWVRGNNYVLRKFALRLFQLKPRIIGFELLYSISVYYVFFVAILLSDTLFLLCLSDLIFIPVLGPYNQVWTVAVILFFMEILLALSREKGEDTPLNILLIFIMYFTYCQLWLVVVLKGFYDDFILKRDMRWAKTERFVIK